MFSHGPAMLTAALLPAALAAVAAFPGGWLAALFVRTQVPAPQIPSVWLAAALLVLWLWAAMVVPNAVFWGATLFLAWALLVLGAVDLLAYRLPDVVTLPLIAAGLLLSLALPIRDPVGHMAGAAIGFAALFGISVGYLRVRGREGLGLGDAKLAAAAGAWLGWRPLPWVLLVACAAGFIAIGIGVMVRGKRAMQEEIAFGVPLCLGFWIVWLYGTPLS